MILSDEISAYIFLAVMGLMVLIILAIPTISLYFIYKWLAKKGYKLVGIILIVCFGLWFMYSIYTGVYPPDSFYYDEFKEVTSREIPSSSMIMRKSASYPDFHGDYCSASVIKLSKQDFDLLLSEIKQDHRFKSEEALLGSSQLHEVMTDYQDDQMLNFTRDNHSSYLGIGFLDKTNVIVVTICVS